MIKYPETPQLDRIEVTQSYWARLKEFLKWCYLKTENMEDIEDLYVDELVDEYLKIDRNEAARERLALIEYAKQYRPK